MPARVIDADVGFGELPYVALHACVGRGIHLAHRAVPLAKLSSMARGFSVPSSFRNSSVLVA